ncbi:hypothetical protein ACOSQ2_033264 [Xanthoceras sorbifolium]
MPTTLNSVVHGGLNQGSLASGSNRVCYQRCVAMLVITNGHTRMSMRNSQVCFQFTIWEYWAYLLQRLSCNSCMQAIGPKCSQLMSPFSRPMFKEYVLNLAWLGIRWAGRLRKEFDNCLVKG